MATVVKIIVVHTTDEKEITVNSGGKSHTLSGINSYCQIEVDDDSLDLKVADKVATPQE